MFFPFHHTNMSFCFILKTLCGTSSYKRTLTIKCNQATLNMYLFSHMQNSLCYVQKFSFQPPLHISKRDYYKFTFIKSSAFWISESAFVSQKYSLNSFASKIIRKDWQIRFLTRFRRVFQTSFKLQLLPNSCNTIEVTHFVVEVSTLRVNFSSNNGN